MFFELPSHKVKVGDIWSIGVNFTQLGQYFVAERAEQINIVKLASVSKNESGSRIATIDYMITEKIKGRFKEPGQTKERRLEGVTSFIGKGEFNLDQGRWQSFVAQMRIKSSGTLSGDIRQILKMTPVDQIPDALLKLE